VKRGGSRTRRSERRWIPSLYSVPVGERMGELGGEDEGERGGCGRGW
jgi:hypothetical protein